MPERTLEFMKIVDKVDQILEETTTEDQLRWDIAKQLRGVGMPCANQTSKTELNNFRRTRTHHKLQGPQNPGRLKNPRFDKHIKTRTQKPENLLNINIMARLGNTNGGISPKAMRAPYVEAIRPILPRETRPGIAPTAERTRSCNQ